MNCPKCGSKNVYVIDSRKDDQQRVFRRRKCTDCGEQFRTIENVYVKNGKKQNTETKLTPVCSLPEKQYNTHTDISFLCDEFLKMNTKYARIDISSDDGRNLFYVYSSLRQIVLRKEYPFYIINRNCKLYFVRFDGGEYISEVEQCD